MISSGDTPESIDHLKYVENLMRVKNCCNLLLIISKLKKKLNVRTYFNHVTHTYMIGICLLYVSNEKSGIKYRESKQ